MLFCDVTGSTALGESTDPEALRALLARYFERMKGIVEAHGGTVEKFIGDAVMAVFGVPQLHEDDALRACRAAVEMRDALPELGVHARIGLNTGEVVTGTQERLATGDAVNVAARLEQAAQPGEILLGEETLALVSDAAEIEAVEPLELKGKAERVAAYRLAAVREEVERRHASTFVGREPELRTLLESWQRARDEERCALVTILGDPGVGKSRLAAEFLAQMDAKIVRGRCLSYGKGITYWPVVEVLRQLDAFPSDPVVAAPLRSLLGETQEPTSADEIAWAFRKLLEEQARERPLVCLFDDIQWGEETFLDLVEQVKLLSTGARLLLLCLARPELAQRRPQWLFDLRLEPLPVTDIDALIPASFPDELRERIERAAGGNPLFVTEMVAMAQEAEGDVAVPPNLKALLGARLDQLDQPERSVLERGAVEGELFHRTAVQALSGNGQVAPRLAALVRKELVRPDTAQLPGDDAFRFCHLLIRDAAYEALPKYTRAELHERFASWLEERASDLVELDEILGHHLEQAARYKAELEQPDAVLAERGAERLATAGRRALDRGDDRAAVSLLERSLALTRPLALDVHLEVDLAQALATDPRRAAAIGDRAADQAAASGDRAGEALARVVSARYRLDFAPETALAELDEFARAALPLLEQVDDHAGLVHVYNAVGESAHHQGRWGEWNESREQALRHAHLTGRQSTQSIGLGAAYQYVIGPVPADELLGRLDLLLQESSHPGLLLNRARLLAMLDRPDEAQQLARQASARLRELTGDDGGEHYVAEVATFAGDHAAAAIYLREFCDTLETQHHLSRLSTYAPRLGRSLCLVGRYDEAEPLAEQGRALGAEHDALTQTLWREVQALVHAHRERHSQAEPLAREAVAIIERTDWLTYQGDALCDLAEVLAAAGRTDEAAEALEQALERYARKKNLAMVSQVRPVLEELRARLT